MDKLPKGWKIIDNHYEYSINADFSLEKTIHGNIVNLCSIDDFHIHHEVYWWRPESETLNEKLLEAQTLCHAYLLGMAEKVKQEAKNECLSCTL